MAAPGLLRRPPPPSAYARVYYDPAHPAGFGSVASLAEAVPGANQRGAAAWLSGQPTYGLHRPARKRFNRGKIVVDGLDHQWAADLISLVGLAGENSQFKYILTVVDALSKYAWARPLKDKTNFTVIKAFKSIFSEGRQPRTLRTDRGTEFTGRPFLSFLKEKNIVIYFADNPTKEAMVERFNRTLQSRLWRYFTATNKKRYVDVLPGFMLAYNGKKHRTIGRAPDSVTSYNAHEVWSRMYGGDHKKKHKGGRRLFKAGDCVRLSRAKEQFEQGYKHSWTGEIFIVDKAVGARYVVKDEDGERIEGTFQHFELQLVKRSTLAIKRVVKRTRTEKLVTWRGLPNTLMTWLPL